MSRKRFLVCSGALTALALGIGATAPALAQEPAPVPEATAAGSGCQTTGAYEVCTTNPDAYGERDVTIVNRLIEYAEDTTSGTIHGAMYMWDLTNAPEASALVTAMTDAVTRGVDVRIIVGQNDSKPHRNDAAIEGLTDGGVTVKQCADGCLPNGSGDLAGAMHMKFFTFSANQQVVHTSSNMTNGQFQRHQNLLSVTGDELLYENYVGFWNRMNVNSWTFDGDTWTGSERGRDGSTPGTKSYFFPRTQADPIRGTLEKLSCENGGRVWVAASLFRDAERIPVRDQLDRLHDAGCDVRVIVADGGDKEFAMAGRLGDAEVNVLNGTGAEWESHHNKLIVTDAYYEGSPRTAVYAGSHNLNATSLRSSSDGTLRVTDPDVFSIYADYYAEMWELSRDH